MGIFDTIFGKNTNIDANTKSELENWNDIVYTRKDLDMDDPVQRREYIESCLQQMEEAARELDLLEMEYNDVTSHLRDMEEIDALPPEQRAEINTCAARILESQEKQEEFNKRKNRITDSDYDRMERLEGEARSGIKKLSEAEEYQKKIRNDLKRLDGEHEAYLYRQIILPLLLYYLKVYSQEFPKCHQLHNPL